MLYADDAVHVREKLDSVLKKESSNLMRDWPGIRMPYQGGLYLWRTNGRILLKEFRHLTLHEAEYDPASRKLHLRFRAREGSRLAISADLKAERIEHDGKVEVPRYENGLLVLPSASGNHDISVVFR